jgi:proteasome accessory factor C
VSRARITAAARVQRLLAILQWAADRPEGVEVAELCQRFRLKPGDVVKELELAAMVGADSIHYDEMPFEVFVEDGRVYVRLFSFRRPMRLTPAEGLALVAAADVLVDREQRGPDGRPGPLERALDKLAALLGITPGQALEIDLDPDGGEAGRRLRTAIAERRRVRFRYWTYGRDEVAERTVEPWALVVHQGIWYLDGWAVDAGAERRFRLDRLADLEDTDEPCTVAPPAPRGPEPGVAVDAPQVVLDLDARARWVVDAHPVLAAEEHGDRLRVTLAVSGTTWLERLLVRLGPHARVVSIDRELGGADLAARTAARVLERYGRAGGPAATG